MRELYVIYEIASTQDRNLEIHLDCPVSIPLSIVTRNKKSSVI